MSTFNLASKDGAHSREFLSWDEVIPTKLVNKGLEKPVRTPAHQEMEFHGTLGKVSITYQPALSTSLLQSTGSGPFDFVIRPEDVDQCTGACLKMRFVAAGTVQPIHSADIIDRVEWWSSKGRIQTQYGPQLYMLNALMSREQYRNMMRSMNLNEFYRQDDSNKMYNGQTRDLYVPLYLSWLEHCKPHIGELKENIRCRVYFRTGGILSSGTASNLTITEFQLILDAEQADPISNQIIEKRYEEEINQFNILDVQTYQLTGQTITNATAYNVTLESFKGKCAGLFFGIRSSPSIASEGLLKYLDLGELATVDIQNASSNPLYGNGTALQARYIRGEESAKWFPSDMFKHQAIYFLPFGDFSAARIGSIVGYRYFDGSRFQLSIIPGTGSGTNCIQTVTLTNAANDGGYYQLAIGDSITDSLVYNTSAANMKVAFDALPYMRKRGLTSTFSGTAEATFTVTFVGPNGPGYEVEDFVRIVPSSLNDGGVAEVGVTTQTTAPICSWTTASTYQIDVFALMWKSVFIENGRVKPEDLQA